MADPFHRQYSTICDEISIVLGGGQTIYDKTSMGSGGGGGGGGGGEDYIPQTGKKERSAFPLCRM